MSSKDELFSRNEVCLYTNLSLRQIEILIAKKIIVPQKNPIRFTYNQLIYCGIFSLLREKFSWEKSVRYLNYCIKHVEQGNNIDVVTIYPKYGRTLTSYALAEDVKKEIISIGRLSETLINQKVDLSLTNNKVIFDDKFIIYIPNLIISFKDKARNTANNMLEKLGSELEIHLEPLRSELINNRK